MRSILTLSIAAIIALPFFVSSASAQGLYDTDYYMKQRMEQQKKNYTRPKHNAFGGSNNTQQPAQPKQPSGYAGYGNNSNNNNTYVDPYNGRGAPAAKGNSARGTTHLFGLGDSYAPSQRK